jgi:hypothetical protein
MRPGNGRRQALVAALLLLPVLALVAGPLVSHEGHGCRFERSCLACRWAADAVADTAAPVSMPQPLDPVAVVAAEPAAPPARRPFEAVSSRGPPLA